MSKSVLAWQAASVARAPVFSMGGSIVERAPRPIAHITRQKRLADLLSIGDTVWIVGKYANLSNASANLIGRIVVADKTIDNGVVIFPASPESHWLPWNDASSLLSLIRFDSKKGPVRLLPSIGIAQQLQTTREIASGSQEYIENYSAALRALPSVFISYNWAFATDVMPSLLPALSEIGFSIWVDRWSGPRRFKDGNNLQPADLITKLLADAIARVDLVLAIIVDEYETSRWTSVEASIARDNNKPIVPLPLVEIRRHIQLGSLGAFLAGHISACTAAPTYSVQP